MVEETDAFEMKAQDNSLPGVFEKAAGDMPGSCEKWGSAVSSNWRTMPLSQNATNYAGSNGAICLSSLLPKLQRILKKSIIINVEDNSKRDKTQCEYTSVRSSLTDFFLCQDN